MKDVMSPLLLPQYEYDLKYNASRVKAVLKRFRSHRKIVN